MCDNENYDDINKAFDRVCREMRFLQKYGNKVKFECIM